MEETKNTNDQPDLNTSPAQGETNANPVPPETQESLSATPAAQAEQVVETSAVTAKPPSPEKLESEVADVTSNIVSLIGIRASVRAKVQEDGTYYVNLRSRNSDGLLIGKRGMTIVSIQAMVNQIMKHRYPTLAIDVFVDVSGYRKRRESFMKKKALAVAKIVLETKREMALDILTEREFHMVEKEIIPLGTVRIYGVGSGSKRTVVIAPL